MTEGVRTCAAIRDNGARCRSTTLKGNQRCAWHSASPRARRRGTASGYRVTVPRRSSAATVRGWLAAPARELLGLPTAEMAERLGVTEDMYASWEADERPMGARKFGRLMRLLNADQRRAYVERVFVPMFEAEFGMNFRDSASADGRNLTRSVGTPSDAGSGPAEST